MRMPLFISLMITDLDSLKIWSSALSHLNGVPGLSSWQNGKRHSVAAKAYETWLIRSNHEWTAVILVGVGVLHRYISCTVGQCPWWFQILQILLCLCQMWIYLGLGWYHYGYKCLASWLLGRSWWWGCQPRVAYRRCIWFYQGCLQQFHRISASNHHLTQHNLGVRSCIGSDPMVLWMWLGGGRSRVTLCYDTHSSNQILFSCC